MEAAAGGSALTAAWISAAASTAATAGSTTATGIGKKKQQKRAIAFQREVNALNRQWALEDRAYMNSYNSPTNQRKLYADAGYVYNPNGENINSVDTAAPNAQAPDISPYTMDYSGYGDAVSQGVNTIMAYKKMQSDIELQKKQEYGIDVAANVAAAQINEMVERTLGMKLDNYIKDKTKDMSVEQATEFTEQVRTQTKIMAATLRECIANAGIAENAFANNPELWKHTKKIWESEEMQKGFEAKIAKFEFEMKSKYGDDMARTMRDMATTELEKAKEQLKNMKYFNQDELLDLQYRMMMNAEQLQIVQGSNMAKQGKVLDAQERSISAGAQHQENINSATIVDPNSGKTKNATTHQVEQAALAGTLNSNKFAMDRSFVFQFGNHMGQLVGSFVGLGVLQRAFFNASQGSVSSVGAGGMFSTTTTTPIAPASSFHP